MIVVAIANPNRDRDLTPGAGSDGPEKYLRFISEELVPYVEQRFRVENHRTLYGASAAGLFVLYALLERPDAFAAYIASSPTVWYRYDYMVAKATSASRPRPRRRTQLHIVYGDKESPAIREGLAKEGLPALESHYEQLSRRLGFRVPVPEDDLKRLGFLLLENGKSRS